MMSDLIVTDATGNVMTQRTSLGGRRALEAAPARAE
jgi:hypothetical protein